MVEKRWGNMVLDRGKAASNAMILSVFPNQGHNGASHKRKKKKVGKSLRFSFFRSLHRLAFVGVCVCALERDRRDICMGRLIAHSLRSEGKRRMA